MMQPRKLRLQMCFVLLFVGAVFGRPLVILAADPNACGPQQDYRLSMPMVDRLPAPDPNLPWGSIIGPVAGDPNAWDIPAGPFKRDGRACDPEGDRFVVTFLGGTSPAVVQVDVEAQWWTFATTAVVGLNAWRFEASDGHSARIVTVMAWGLANEPPVVE